MAETRTSLAIPPGIYRNGTDLQSAGRWFDANGIRFMDKTVIKPIGGWRRAIDNTSSPLPPVEGLPRATKVWLSDSGDVYLAIGTTTNLKAVVGGAMADIAPLDLVAGREDTDVLPPTPTSGGGSAYDVGPYNIGPYGQGSTFGVKNEATRWQLDTFGTFLVAVCSSDGRLLIWDGDPSQRAHAAVGAPFGARGVVVTPERFVVLLGVTSPSALFPTGSQDVRAVAWANQETFENFTDVDGTFYDYWTPSNVNSAGDFVLSTPGRIMCGQRTRRETLLWTDVDLHTMTYIGGDLIYRFDQAGNQCGIVSSRAYAVVDTSAYWMGREGFFMYDGFVRSLPSDVHDYVFSDFNRTQSAKVWAMSISQFGEVWWFYPSSRSKEIDRYVVYNYRENHWTIGQLARTTGADADGAQYPIMVAPTGEIYEHEVREATRDGMTPFLASGPQRLGEGDQVVRVQKIYPDEKALGEVQATIYARLDPMAPETTHTTMNRTVETNVRLTGRQFRVRLDEVTPDDWRIGTFSFGLVPGGQR